jgi:hypothetical protein
MRIKERKITFEVGHEIPKERGMLHGEDLLELDDNGDDVFYDVLSLELCQDLARGCLI